MEFFLFPIQHACPIPSFALAASCANAGSVLITKETVVVIMSTLINVDDNEQYYFFRNVLCWGVGTQLPILIKGTKA